MNHAALDISDIGIGDELLINPGIPRQPASYLPALSEAYRSSVAQLFVDAICYRQICQAEATGNASETERVRDAVRRGAPTIADPANSAGQISMYRYMARELGISLNEYPTCRLSM